MCREERYSTPDLPSTSRRNKIMYCGDEVAAIVGDVGTDTCKFGYGGEDSPKHVFSSTAGYLPVAETSIRDGGPAGGAVGMDVDGSVARVGTGVGGARGPGGGRWLVGDLAVPRRRDGMEMRNPLVNGLMSDWEQIEKLWEHAFEHRLRATASERPVLIAEASWSTAKERRGLMELMFEKFGVPAMYPAKNAVLSAFSAGRATALVCDCGHGATSAVPVVDGYVLNLAVQRGIRGGDWLTQQVYTYLAGKGLPITPRYAINLAPGDKQAVQLLKAGSAVGPVSAVSAGAKGKASVKDSPRSLTGSVVDAAFPGTHPSYAHLMRMEIVRELKETCMRIPLDESTSEEDEEEETEYLLPDGTKVELTDELRNIPDMLMEGSAMVPLNNAQDNLRLDLPLPSLLRRGLEMSDADARKEMAGNVVLTGGGSLFDGMPERITSELTASLPSAFKVRTLTASPIERRFSVWIGGSIMCSLGTFQQLWLSKRQYEEQGAEVAENRRFQG